MDYTDFTADHHCPGHTLTVEGAALSAPDGERRHRSPLPSLLPGSSRAPTERRPPRDWACRHVGARLPIGRHHGSAQLHGDREPLLGAPSYSNGMRVAHCTAPTTVEDADVTASSKQLIWFITAASRGFGLEIARAALQRGDAAVATRLSLSTGFKSAA
jgi:hypothetical protein